MRFVQLWQGNVVQYSVAPTVETRLRAQAINASISAWSRLPVCRRNTVDARRSPASCRDTFPLFRVSHRR